MLQHTEKHNRFIIDAFGKASDHLWGIVSTVLGVLIGLGGILSNSNSTELAAGIAVSCGLVAMAIIALIQVFVMRACVEENARLEARETQRTNDDKRYREAIHESDRVFRKLQEKRKNIDRFLLRQLTYHSDNLRPIGIEEEINAYLHEICNIAVEAIAKRNLLGVQEFSANIKLIYPEGKDYFYDTAARSENTDKLRKENKKTKFKVTSHAVFEKLLHDPRRRHIIRNLSNFLEKKVANGGNGLYTGPSHNALQWYNSSITVAIYNSRSDDNDELDRLSSIQAIETANGDFIHGFLSIDTKSVEFSYENSDVDMLRELAICAYSAISVFKIIKSKEIKSI